MIKNIMGAAIAVALAVGIGTTGVRSIADLNIYVLDRTYNYQLWETDLSHDISSDSYLGNGTIKRPVGLIITVSKNS